MWYFTQRLLIAHDTSLKAECSWTYSWSMLTAIKTLNLAGAACEAIASIQSIIHVLTCMSWSCSVPAGPWVLLGTRVLPWTLLTNLGYSTHDHLHVIRDFFQTDQFERCQCSIVIAWALTTHKVQGNSLDKAVIDLGDDVFDPVQAYVALSRVRRLEGVLLISLCTGYTVWYSRPRYPVQRVGVATSRSTKCHCQSYNTALEVRGCWPNEAYGCCSGHNYMWQQDSCQEG